MSVNFPDYRTGYSANQDAYSVMFNTPDDHEEWLFKKLDEIGHESFVNRLTESIVEIEKRIALKREEFSKLVYLEAVSLKSLKPIFQERRITLRKTINEYVQALGEKHFDLSMLKNGSIPMYETLASLSKDSKDPELAFIDDTLNTYRNCLRDTREKVMHDTLIDYIRMLETAHKERIAILESLPKAD